eukprot:TRINITY_DN1885_c0_g1_i1.p1 TRINITY_DN1885_c0_g1~~TRINITY_DN1885_c0_g1_i1.p1  ORF type:complete len:211 (-),score=53.23 TRINITY_DN1885_c0_g1_i1:102-734(-)
MNLFGSKPTPPDVLVKKWSRELQHEARLMDREIRVLDREELKTKMNIKQLAKKEDTASMKTLAKEIVRLRNAKTKLYKSKSQLLSVKMQLQTQLATLRMTRCLAKSTQVMTQMNNLIKLPQLQSTMMAMSREMEKAGLIEEMMSDTLDSVGDEDDLEEEAEEEVDKVLEEISKELMGKIQTITPNCRLNNEETEPKDTDEDGDGAIGLKG